MNLSTHETFPSDRTRSSAWAAVFVFSLTAVLFLFVPALLHHLLPGFDIAEPKYLKRLFAIRTYLLNIGVFAVAWLLFPMAKARGWQRWSTAKTVLLLSALSLGLIAFIVAFGNRQFGGWDMSILIDTGWRQLQGQRPYIDFITPNPPGFNLGILEAFRIFGLSWNAQLYAIALFAVVTMVWIFLLLRRGHTSNAVSVLLAFAVECMTVLPVCFWWYNDTTDVLGAVFALSVVLCAQQEDTPGWGLWLSYALSLGLLCLMKPNIAGLLVCSGVLLLIVAARNKVAMIVSTVFGFVLAALIILLTHVSVNGMLASYHAASIERGGLSHFGLVGYSKGQLVLLLLWTLALAIPLLAVWPRCRVAWRTRSWSQLASLLLLLPVLPVTLYGMATNGEIKDSEAAGLVLIAGMIALGWRWSSVAIRRFFVAMVFAALASTLYFGASRQRVYGIGNHMFYEAKAGTADTIHDGFFTQMKASPEFDAMQHEITTALQQNPGSVFFGPRLEYGYSDHHLPSPEGWPVYYQPGTSFARADVPRLTAAWEEDHFQTLIFLHDDRTFYPNTLLAVITQEYKPEPGYRAIDVYRRKR